MARVQEWPICTSNDLLLCASSCIEPSMVLCYNRIQLVPAIGRASCSAVNSFVSTNAVTSAHGFNKRYVVNMTYESLVQFNQF
jgi:hypothetical protein